MNSAFWNGKKVLITGHTGFKGSWLSYWLTTAGADIIGYSVAIPTSPSLFQTLKLPDKVTDTRADIQDYDRLKAEIIRTEPDIVFHLAAQSLVLESYRNPVDTYAVNVMGTVNLLDAVRHAPSVKACVIVTSDKCYKNKEQEGRYIETDEMGGRDPYSSSKGCAELVTDAFRRSFFSEDCMDFSDTLIASVRAGNVIGGGDWAADRLIPDCISALHEKREMRIRYPDAVRPWQHVLEPLAGYILLAEKLVTGGRSYADAFNFGPEPGDCKTVKEIVNLAAEVWGGEAHVRISDALKRHEAGLLMLDNTKAKSFLGWHPVWDIKKAVNHTLDWYRAYYDGGDMESVTRRQIETYISESR